MATMVESAPGTSRDVAMKWLRPTEFARATGVSRAQVYRWIYSGQLRAKQVGRIWLIPVEEITEFFEREAA